MLKFIKGHMTSIEGVDLFPVMAFLLFLGIFLFVIWWVYGMRRDDVDRMSALPLASDDNQATNEHAH